LDISSEPVVCIDRNLVLSHIRIKSSKNKLDQQRPSGRRHQLRNGVGHPSQNQLLACSTTFARKLELWIFNPCTSMGIGHQVGTSCVHQQEPGAESHQEEKFQNKLNQLSFWLKASTTEPRWTSKPEPVVGMLYCYHCQKT
jgi:hypothetical protein